MRHKLLIVLLLLFSISFADGLLMPTEEDYPKDFLRNRMTSVNIKIHGLIAEVSVYQEFVNEGNDSTNAVFSFPLPDAAKATRFLYWYEDKVYEAILKVQEQSQNPGHGTSDLAEQVNEYIGNNGIKIQLKNIKAGAIQRTELHYITTLEYNNGTNSLEFPLNTEEFISFPYDLFEMKVSVSSNSPIMFYNFPGFNDITIEKDENFALELKLTKPKFYPNKNIAFQYTISQEAMGTDFYSANNDTSAGHFGLFVKPPLNVDSDSLFNKRVIFLLSRAGDMQGVKFEESITGIKRMLDNLGSSDQFNILTFDYNTSLWRDNCSLADSGNIESAKNWLDGLSTGWGSDLGQGLQASLNQITDDDFNNMIVLFTGGLSFIDPQAIAEQNQYNAGIFPIGFGDDLSYAQLEMTAAENYGFVTYIDDNDNIYNKLDMMWNRINRPVLKETGMEYGGVTLSQMLPEKIPAYYSGSYFFTTGRYDAPAEAALSIGGESVNGFKTYDFELDFTANTDTNKFIEKFWAKAMIDRLEWETELYGETAEKKQQLIDLSLKYNIRCMYTAYIADYENIYTAIDDQNNIQIPKSFIAGNYPNPFNPSTNFKIYLGDKLLNGAKLLKIYDILGRLVAVIDISHLQPGWNTVLFNGQDTHGNPLPSGVYIVSLQIGNRIVSTAKINLMK